MDQTAEFEALVRQHKGQIYSICYMYAKSNEEKDDFFQEVLINLWLGYPKFRHDSDIKTWIWRISINTCITYIRKANRKPETISLIDNIDTADDNTVEDQRQIDILYARINRLDRLEKAMVLLWLENMSYDDIASIMGMSVPAVASKLMRIKNKLKEMSNK